MNSVLLRLSFLTLILGLFMIGCSQHRYRNSAYNDIDHDLVVDTARDMLGVNYSYGGENPSTGFDCSGLVVFSYQQAGVMLPRTTYGQFKRTRPVRRSVMQAGDLVFFRISRSKISHVGIYLGNNRFIHAPSSGKSVSIANLNDPYWSKRFIRGGRI